MADDDLDHEGADEQVLDTPPDDEQQANDDPIANIAAELGWKPKEQWQGDPEAWKEPADFIRAGREIQQGTSRELRAVRDQLDRLGNVTSRIMEDKVAERDAFWQAQMEKAVDAGDTATVLRLTEQRPGKESAPNTGEDPEVARWRAQNKWFDEDPAAKFRAAEVSNQLRHLPVAEQLAAAERIVRKEFPEHFPAPAKAPPATQTAASRNANPGNRAKGFAEMPEASKRLALQYKEQHGVSTEAFARSYWADQERVKR